MSRPIRRISRRLESCSNDETSFVESRCQYWSYKDLLQVIGDTLDWECLESSNQPCRSSINAPKTWCVVCFADWWLKHCGANDKKGLAMKGKKQ